LLYVVYNLINLKHRKTTVLLLSLLFFIAQTSVTAVIGVDTLGQLIFTFFGILSFISLESFTKRKTNYKLLMINSVKFVNDRLFN
jgi:hypothetical protein